MSTRLGERYSFVSNCIIHSIFWGWRIIPYNLACVFIFARTQVFFLRAVHVRFTSACARPFYFGLRPKHRTRRGPRDMAATRNMVPMGRGYGRAALANARLLVLCWQRSCRWKGGSAAVSVKPPQNTRIATYEFVKRPFNFRL